MIRATALAACLVFLACAGSPASAAEVTATLRSVGRSPHRFATLGAFCELAGPGASEVADLVLVRLGRPGSFLRMSRAQVADRLAGRSERTISLRGADEIRIERLEPDPAAAAAAWDRIAAAVTNAAFGAGPTDPGHTLKVRQEAEIPLDLAAAPGVTREIRVRDLARGRATVLVIDADGTARPLETRIPVLVTESVRAPRLVRDLPAQAVLTASDTRIETVERPYEATPGGVAREGADLAGFVLRRAARTGTVVTPEMVERRPLVRTGVACDLIERHGAVDLTVKVVPLRSGAEGDRVDVRSTLSGKVIAAVVVGPGQVGIRR